MRGDSMPDSKLYIIVYDHQDSEPNWFHTVGVDMDQETAELLVVKHLADTYDEKFRDELTFEDLDVNNVWYETATVEGWDIEPTEEVA